MNKIRKFLFIFGVLFLAGNAFATVGGPTYISEIAFSSNENSIYYKVHDGGGRGCPPILHKVNLATLADSEVKSCTQVENEYSYNDMQKYEQSIADIYENLSYLGSVSFLKNNINVKVKFLSEHIQDDFLFWSNFRATISQDGKEVGEIDFKGCVKDQPHVFEGYMIPNSDKMAILISNKGDCFEGGYVGESLHVIRGVKYYDKNMVRSFKQASATEPNVGNMVVYAGADSTSPINPPLSEDVTPENKKNNYGLYVAVVVLGLALGYFLGRKVKN